MLRLYPGEDGRDTESCTREKGKKKILRVRFINGFMVTLTQKFVLVRYISGIRGSWSSLGCRVSSSRLDRVF